jgi:hypothetical protein
LEIVAELLFSHTPLFFKKNSVSGARNGIAQALQLVEQRILNSGFG